MKRYFLVMCLLIICITLLTFTFLTRETLYELRFRDGDKGGRLSWPVSPGKGLRGESSPRIWLPG